MATQTPAGAGSSETERSLWRHHDFVRLFSAQGASQIGFQITAIALPLTAIITLDATPFQVGALTALQFLPFLLIGLPAGVWVDRLRRRPILVASSFGRAAVLAIVPVSYLAGYLNFPLLFTVALLVGLQTVFYDIAYQSYLPHLVGRERLLEGNSKLETMRVSAQLGGPGIGGWLVQVLTAPVALASHAITYLIGGLCLLSIRKPEPEPAPAAAQPGMLRLIKEGLQFVFGHPLVRSVLICTGIVNFGFGATQAMFMLFAVRGLGYSAGVIGVIFMIGNAGGLLGALVSRRLVRQAGVATTVVLTTCAFAIGWLLVPLSTPATGYVQLSVAMSLTSFGAIAYNITQVSLRQAVTPSRLQGRMNSVMRFAIWGVIPFGSLLGGVIASGLGPRAVLFMFAPMGLVAALFALLSPLRSVREIPVLEEDDPEGARSPDDGGKAAARG
jgi:MFS family permease